MNSFSEGEDDITVKLEPLEACEDVKPQLSRKRHRSFGSDSFSESEERNIQQKLDVGLSRNETMQRPGPGGCRLTYIEGWKVIHDANQIFGFNGWSSSIVALDVRFIDDKGGRFSACVSAHVRITLRDGASREDRGGGVSDNMRSKGDAILKAEKEAVTDATKRALKNFGLRLGLSLYDRQHVREMNKPQNNNINRAATARAGVGVVGMQAGQARKQSAGSGHGRSGQEVGTMKTTGARAGMKGMGVGAARVGNGNGGAGGSGHGGVGGETAGGDHFAAQREQAMLRKQAFLRAKAAEEKGKMQRMNNGAPTALRGGNGVSRTTFPVRNGQEGNGGGVGGGGMGKGNVMSPVTPVSGVGARAGGYRHGANRGFGAGVQLGMNEGLQGGVGQGVKESNVRLGAGDTDYAVRQREIDEAMLAALDTGV